LRAGVSGEENRAGCSVQCMWGRRDGKCRCMFGAGWGTANNVAILPMLQGCGEDPGKVSVNGVLVMCFATCSCRCCFTREASYFQNNVGCAGANDDAGDKVYLY